MADDRAWQQGVCALFNKQMSDFDTRFSGIRRLYSVAGLERLRRSHVCVIGIGGVGSWVVEALARTGLGRLTLIDMDEICVSNVNRQLHALDGAIGKPKVEAMAERVQAINPECQVTPVCEFFLESNAEQHLSGGYDFVVDAMDALSKKALLISLCRDKKMPIITMGGAGGRRDPTQVKVNDLAFTSHDGLRTHVRSELRSKRGVPTDPKLPGGVVGVFSPEPIVYPHSNGTVCATKEEGSATRLNCDNGYGTATFVTGTFGFVAAARVVDGLSKDEG
jgi:tRNA A37 threonylcarbamoyladenosine dehydratase